MHWLDATVWLALGGSGVGLFLHFLQRLPLVPRELWEETENVEPLPSSPGHETRDISVPGVTWFAAGLVLAAIVIFPVVIGLFHLFERQHPSPDASSRIAHHPRMIAPLPQLQVNPAVAPS